jgi:HK97 family phage major capsid protein
MDRAAIQAKLRALAEEGEKIYKTAVSDNRQVTDEEAKRISEIEAQLDQCEADLKRCDQQSGFEKRVADLRKFPDAVEDPVPGDKIVEDRSDYHRWPVEEADQFFRAVQAWQTTRSLPDNIHADLRETLVGALEKRAPTGHGTLIDAEGGWAVPTTINQTVLRKAFGEGSIVSRCQNVPITNGNSTTWNMLTENSRVAGSRYGGIQVYRAEEAGSVAGTKTKFERLRLTLKKGLALTYVTEEQLADGPQLMQFITELVPKAIRFKTDDEIFNGTGGIQMEGILASNALVTVAKETGQAAATVLYENIVAMWSRMFAPSRSNAVWFINQDIEPQLLTMTLGIGTAGVPVYLPAGGASSSPYGTLMGRPVIPTEHNKTLGTVGDILLADFSQYLYASGGGISTSQSMHVKFIEGELALRWMWRDDGKCWWPMALTPAQGSNTLSPFVVLATRA